MKKLSKIIFMSMLAMTISTSPAFGETIESSEAVNDIPYEMELTQDEKDLLALVTMAEAEDQSELGKRLVIDTILNRVDSKHFPNTVSEVIYQKGQFTSMWNGRSDRCHVDNDILALVDEELRTRQNYETIFFRAKKYSKYGTPLFKEGDHCFSAY